MHEYALRFIDYTFINVYLNNSSKYKYGRVCQWCD